MRIVNWFRNADTKLNIVNTETIDTVTIEWSQTKNGDAKYIITANPNNTFAEKQKVMEKICNALKANSELGDVKWGVDNDNITISPPKMDNEINGSKYFRNLMYFQRIRRTVKNALNPPAEAPDINENTAPAPTANRVVFTLPAVLGAIKYLKEKGQLNNELDANTLQNALNIAANKLTHSGETPSIFNHINRLQIVQGR